MLRWMLFAFGMICTALVVQNVIAHAGDPAAAQSVADRQQNTPLYSAAQTISTPSATLPPTVDALATDAASLAATSAVVGTMRAGTETQRIQGTVEARTATAEAWTATAIAGAATLRSAEITAVIAEVNILAETLTAVPPQRTADAVREWHTQNAINTEIAVRATNDAREALQAVQWDGALHLSGVVLLGVVTLLVPVGLLSMIGAAAWRVKGEAGGKGQAAVEAVRRIPTDGGDGEPIVMDDERDALADFVDTCRRMSGDGSTTITPQSQFGSDAGWDGHVRKLAWLGLVKTRPGKGGGTLLTDGRTLAELADVLRGKHEAR